MNPFRKIASLGLALGAAVFLASCNLAPVAQPGAAATVEATLEAPQPIVVLISIDGFRPDYIERGVTPVLRRLADEGAFGPMTPSFPSATFPNHYTQVTGLHPDNHGIVSNTMRDEALGRFSLGNRDAVSDRRWWDDAEPLWVTAERAGIITGTMFWPGSEADIRGVRPSLWSVFDQSLPGDARVDRLLSWLDLPEGQRPRFATLYFDIVDTAGHNHGPDSAEVNEAAASVDASLARLLAGLEARGLSDQVVLVIVSDHGMAETSPERAIYLDDVIDLESVEVLTWGYLSGIYPREGREVEVRAALLRDHANMDCWAKDQIPAHLNYGRHPRVPPYVCLAESGWMIASRARPITRVGGAHGYDPRHPDMAAIVLVHGPGVRAGVTLSDVSAVDVHPLLGALLDLEVPRGDGSLDALRPALIR